MAAVISFEIQGLTTLQQGIGMMAKRLRLAGQRTVAELSKRMHTEVVRAYTNPKWQPTELTQKKRQFLGQPGLPLFKITGAMIASIKRTQSGPDRETISMPWEQAGKAVLFEQGADWSYVPSPKQWGFLCRTLGFFGAPPAVINVHLEARPIWEPALRRVYDDAAGVLYRHLLLSLMGLPGIQLTAGTP